MRKSQVLTKIIKRNNAQEEFHPQKTGHFNPTWLHALADDCLQYPAPVFTLAGTARWEKPAGRFYSLRELTLSHPWGFFRVFATWGTEPPSSDRRSKGSGFVPLIRPGKGIFIPVKRILDSSRSRDSRLTEVAGSRMSILNTNWSRPTSFFSRLTERARGGFGRGS